MTGQELKTLREQRHLTQRDLARLLDVTNASVARWEGDQEIPGPMQKLLELFFHGIHPFNGNSETGSSSISRLELTVDEFLELQRIANRHGFSDVKDYIVFAIRKHIAESKAQFCIRRQPHPGRRQIGTDMVRRLRRVQNPKNC